MPLPDTHLPKCLQANGEESTSTSTGLEPSFTEISGVCPSDTEVGLSPDSAHPHWPNSVTDLPRQDMGSLGSAGSWGVSAGQPSIAAGVVILGTAACSHAYVSSTTVPAGEITHMVVVNTVWCHYETLRWAAATRRSMAGGWKQEAKT